MDYKVGIIGAGIIGNRFSHSLDQHPQLKIKTICDIDLSRAQQLADKYQASATDEITSILDDPEISIVYIGVPPKFHTEYAIKVLERGKHAICEKPIALNQQEVAEMIEARDQSGKITAINLPFRFNLGILKMKDMVQNGEIGAIQQVELRFRFPQWPRSWQVTEWLRKAEQGGPLREVGTHYFFALDEIFGDIANIQAITAYPDDVSCEYRSVANLRFKDHGHIFGNMNLIVDSSEPEENTLIIYGSEGTLYHRGWFKLSMLKDGVETVVLENRINTEYALVENFVKAMAGDQKAENSLVSFEDAGRAQSVLEQILNARA